MSNLIPISEAAKLLGVHAETLRRWEGVYAQLDYFWRLCQGQKSCGQIQFGDFLERLSLAFLASLGSAT